MDLRTQIRVSVRAHKMGLLQAQFVSIHALSDPGDLWIVEFQSAPACPIKTDATAVSIHARPCGRAMLGRHAKPEPLRVSIHARPCGRAMADGCANTTRRILFQSTPALAGGRWRKHASRESAALVSIHARPCGRAMITGGTFSQVTNLFQSTPALAGGR